MSNDSLAHHTKKYAHDDPTFCLEVKNMNAQTRMPEIGEREKNFLGVAGSTFAVTGTLAFASPMSETMNTAREARDMRVMISLRGSPVM